MRLSHAARGHPGTSDAASLVMARDLTRFDTVCHPPHGMQTPRGAPPQGAEIPTESQIQCGGAVTLEPEPGHAGVGTGASAKAPRPLCRNARDATRRGP